MEFVFEIFLIPVFIFSLIYWCINEKRGLGLGIVVLLSIWIHFFLKYLDIHLPLGLIIFGIILCCYFLLGSKIEMLLVKGGFRAGMITAAIVSFLMIVRLQSEEFLMPGGILLGMGTGFCLNYRYVGFKSILLLERTGIAKYLTLFVRFILGIAGFMLIIFAVGKIIPQNSGNVNLYRFLMYALTGLWISAAAPWVFVRLRLAGIEKQVNDA